MRHPERIEMQVIEDLLDWEEENDCLLPDGMSAEDIAELEARGLIVDLTTGKIMTTNEAEAKLWKLL